MSYPPKIRFEHLTFGGVFIWKILFAETCIFKIRVGRLFELL